MLDVKMWFRSKKFWLILLILIVTLWRNRSTGPGLITFKHYDPPRVFEHRYILDNRFMDVTSFDLPKYFKYKESMLVPVRSQEKCASCWAFSVADMIADRISIATGGKTIRHLSPQDLLSCFRPRQFRCDRGGIPELAYYDVIANGLRTEKDSPYLNVLGGEKKRCTRTSAGNTLHFFWPSVDRLFKYPDRVFGKMGTARSLCHPTRGRESVRERNVRNMKIEIMLHGPIVGTITVYDDFYRYDGTSIYRRSPTAKKLGGHAICIIGWCDDGVNTGEHGFDRAYWICRNSWSSVEQKKWPRRSPYPGWFYIEQGTDQCGIESRASSLQPEILGNDGYIDLDRMAYISYESYRTDPERRNYFAWLETKPRH